uniref:Uncharacterized protein n=1 Tax=Pipistrellus kuhlii TaxID=59472 RepID=A0A7J7Y9A2_PIPKU|nr:hypothetical protein mPipKuh1_010349 [Pipistrellus kuhlii]
MQEKKNLQVERIAEPVISETSSCRCSGPVLAPGSQGHPPWRTFHSVTPWRSWKGVALTFLITVTTSLPPDANGGGEWEAGRARRHWVDSWRGLSNECPMLGGSRKFQAGQLYWPFIAAMLLF